MIDFKRLATDSAINYVLDMSKDFKSIEELVKTNLDESLKQGSCFDMKALFDKDENIVKEIDSELINKAIEFAESGDERFSKIAKNIELHMWHFDQKWVMDYLQEKWPDYYMIIVTDAEPEKFKAWMGSQIKNVFSLIDDILRKNKS